MIDDHARLRDLVNGADLLRSGHGDENGVWRCTLLESDMAALKSLLDERDWLLETNTRLNRRCQSAESGLAEKLEKGEAKHRSFGRALANAAAVMHRERLQRLMAAAKGIELEANDLLKVECPTAREAVKGLCDALESIDAARAEGRVP